MSVGKRSFSAPQIVAILLIVTALCLVGYTAFSGAPPFLYAIAVTDLMLAAVLWRVKKKI